MCGFIVVLGIILNFFSWLWSILWPALGYITGGLFLLCLLAGIVTTVKKKMEKDEMEKDEEISVSKKGIAIFLFFLLAIGGGVYGMNSHSQKQAALRQERRLEAQRKRQEEIQQQEREAAEHDRQMRAIITNPTPSTSSVPSTSSGTISSNIPPNDTSSGNALTGSATIDEWKRATRNEKLALCRGFISISKTKPRINASHAKNLVDYIDEAIYILDDYKHNESIASLAVMGMITMEWLQD